VLSVEPATASPGDSVTLVLTNRSVGAIGYNLCTSALERRSGGGWSPVPSGRVCTMELRTLQAGVEVRYGMPLPSGLEPGEYRIGSSFEALDAGVMERVVSEAFRVRSGG
jgi:hypothetical protein